MVKNMNLNKERARELGHSEEEIAEAEVKIKLQDRKIRGALEGMIEEGIISEESEVIGGE